MHLCAFPFCLQRAAQVRRASSAATSTSGTARKPASRGGRSSATISWEFVGFEDFENDDDDEDDDDLSNFAQWISGLDNMKSASTSSEQVNRKKKAKAAAAAQARQAQQSDMVELDVVSAEGRRGFSCGTEA